MKTIKFSLDKKCVLNCCKEFKYFNYNKNILIQHLENNNIERVCVFTYSIKKNIDIIKEIFSVSKEYNIKVTIQTISYIIDINSIKHLIEINDNYSIELLINFDSNCLLEQLNILNNTLKLFNLYEIKHNLFVIKNINTLNELEIFLTKILSIVKKNTPILIYSDIEFNDLNYIKNVLGYEIKNIFSNKQSDNIKYLGYNSCESFSNKSNKLLLRKV